MDCLILKETLRFLQTVIFEEINYDLTRTCEIVILGNLTFDLIRFLYPPALELLPPPSSNGSIVKVRKHLKLFLDDLVSTLKRYLPKINRVNCYRVLRRYDLAVLSSSFQDRGKGKFGYYLPGFLHLDLAYLPLLAGSFQRRYLLVAIDRVTKLVFVLMVKGKTQENSILFLKTFFG